MIGYYVIFGVFALIGMVVSGRLKGKFAHYSRIPVRSGLSGKEVAEKCWRITVCMMSILSKVRVFDGSLQSSE